MAGRQFQYPIFAFNDPTQVGEPQPVGDDLGWLSRQAPPVSPRAFLPVASLFIDPVNPADPAPAPEDTLEWMRSAVLPELRRRDAAQAASGAFFVDEEPAPAPPEDDMGWWRPTAAPLFLRNAVPSLVAGSWVFDVTQPEVEPEEPVGESGPAPRRRKKPRKRQYEVVTDNGLRVRFDTQQQADDFAESLAAAALASGPDAVFAPRGGDVSPTSVAGQEAVGRGTPRADHDALPPPSIPDIIAQHRLAEHELQRRAAALAAEQERRNEDDAIALLLLME